MCDFPDRIFLQHKSKVTGDYFIRNFMQCEKQRLDGMLAGMPKTDSSADDRILNAFETHPQSPGLNHSKRSIENAGITPIQELPVSVFWVLSSHFPVPLFWFSVSRL